MNEVFLRGCLSVLLILGIFYGALYWIYIQIDPKTSVSIYDEEALIERELYEDLLNYRSQALNEFERAKTLNYPPTSSGDKDLERSISRLDEKDALAFIAQSYLSHAILVDDASREQLKGMKPFHAFQLAEVLVNSDLSSFGSIAAYLIRDVRSIHSEEGSFWELLRNSKVGSSLTQAQLAIAIQDAESNHTYNYLLDEGFITSDNQFQTDVSSLALALTCLNNIQADSTRFESTFKSLYLSLINRRNTKTETIRIISYLFSQIDGSQPAWIEDFFVETVSTLSDDDITGFLNTSNYVSHHWGGIYRSFNSEFFEPLPEKCRIAMIDILEKGFVGFFEAQIIEDLENSAYEGKNESSISFYTNQIESNPEDPYNYLERGKILAREFKDYSRALQDFTTAIDLDNSISDAYFQRGLIREKLNDITGSIEDYDIVIELDPENTYAFGNRAIMKHQIGDYLGAIDDYTNTIKIDSNYVDAYYGRGLSRSIHGDTAGAITDYGIVVNIDPTYLDAYVNRSLLYIEQDNLQPAIIDYKMVLGYEGNNLDALYGLAYIYFQTDSLDQSRNYYEQLVQQYPEETDAYYSLGLIHNNQESFQKAYSYFTKTIFMDSTYTDALVQRGWASVNQNDTINACLDWVKALKRNAEDAQYYLDIYCRN